MLTRRHVWTNAGTGAILLAILGVWLLRSTTASWPTIVLWTAMLCLVAVIVAAQLAYVRHRDSVRAKRLAAWWGRPGVRACAAVLMFPAIIAWMVLFTSAFSGSRGSLIASSFDAMHMGLMCSGMFFIMLAFVRGGTEPRCASCEYLLEGAPDGGYEVCPECGGGLRAKGSIATGRKTVIKPMIVVGVALLLLSFASFGRFSRGSARAVPYLPTGALIKEVTAAPRGFTSNEWAELLTRPLTPSQQEDLFEGLIELRERRGHASREAEGWLDRTAMAGSVPGALIERYFEGMLELWIAAPASVSRTSERGLRFGFGGDFRGNIHVPASSILRVWFVPEELLADGEPVVMLHDPRLPIAGISMNTTERRWRDIHRDPVTPASDGPVGMVDPSQIRSDALELRGTGWIYVAPHGTPMPSSGAASPAGAVWVSRVDLRSTVRVED